MEVVLYVWHQFESKSMKNNTYQQFWANLQTPGHFELSAPKIAPLYGISFGATVVSARASYIAFTGKNFVFSWSPKSILSFEYEFAQKF